jgi:crescentin
MSSVWEKLFANRPTPANDGDQVAFQYSDAESTEREASAAAGGFAEGRSAETPTSQKVARTFDSIGRRNETLRAQLDEVEVSFRNIEAIRARFHETLIPIDQTLAEIERAKIAHVEAERKLEGLTTVHERLRSDHATQTLERDALALKRDELAGRVSDLERSLMASEATSTQAKAGLAEREAKLERTERELDDNKRRLQTVSEQLPAIRAEFSAKEKRLQEVEQQRATLHDKHDLMTQENRTLRTRIEEFVASSSKLGRQLNEMEGRRDDLNRRLEELHTTMSQETASHAKLKAAHIDAIDAHRQSLTGLKEELAAMTSRSEAAERLLGESRAALRERDATIRGFEQRALETSLSIKAKETTLADLEKDLASIRTKHAEVDAARLAAVDRSTGLAKALEDKGVALQRAEQRIETLEAKAAQQIKGAIVERDQYEEKIFKLKEQLEAESAARAFADGALQSARQERGARRPDGDPAPAKEASAEKEAPAPKGEQSREKITRLRG